MENKDMQQERLMLILQGLPSIKDLALWFKKSHEREYLDFVPTDISQDFLSYGGFMGFYLVAEGDLLSIYLPTVTWDGQTPVPSTRLWKKLDLTEINNDNLRELLIEALQTRLNEFKPCQYCGRYFPPEYRYNEDVCHGCAEEHPGVVY